MYNFFCSFSTPLEIALSRIRIQTLGLFSKMVIMAQSQTVWRAVSTLLSKAVHHVLQHFIRCSSAQNQITNKHLTKRTHTEQKTAIEGLSVVDWGGFICPLRWRGKYQIQEADFHWTLPHKFYKADGGGIILEILQNHDLGIFIKLKALL